METQKRDRWRHRARIVQRPSCGETASVIDLASARVRLAPAVKRLPLPPDLLALAQVGVEIEARPGGRFWRAVEARMRAHVESAVPRGVKEWKVSWDAERFDIVLRWKT